MAKKSYKLTCLVFTFNSRLHDTTSVEHYVDSQLFHLSVTLITCNIARERVVHQCVNLFGPKKVHLTKLLTSVNIVI